MPAPLTSTEAPRAHLLEKLDNHGHQFLTILNAKQGYGKKSLINQWITSRKLTAIKVNLSDSHLETQNQTDILWHTLSIQAEALFNIAPLAPTHEAFKSALRAHIPPLTVDEPPTVEQSEQYIDNLKQKVVIIIDSYQLSSPETDRLLLPFINAVGDRVGIILITQHTPPKTFFPFYSSTNTLLLSELELKFNRLEIHELIGSTLLKNRDQSDLFNEEPKIRITTPSQRLVIQHLFDLFYTLLDGWPALVQHCLNEISQLPYRTELESGNTDFFTSAVTQSALQKLELYFQNVEDDTFSDYIQTAQLPTVSPTLSSMLWKKSSVIRSFNRLHKRKFMLFARGQRAEFIDAHPILRQFRLQKLDEQQADREDDTLNPLQTACNWYYAQDKIADALSAFISLKDWPSFIGHLEHAFTPMLESGQWHLLKPIIEKTPISILSGHTQLMVNITYTALLSQNLNLFFRLLPSTLTITASNESSTEIEVAKLDYLQQIATNYKNNPENGYSESELTTSCHRSFSHLLPTLKSQGISAELNILESYRQLFCEESLEKALDHTADALELALDQDNVFLTFHSLIQYSFLMEHIGEIKNIHQCCNMLNAWAQSKYYCGFPMANVIQMVAASYFIEKSTINNLRSETGYLTTSFTHNNVASDIVLEFLFYRTLTTLYKATLATSLAHRHMKNVAGTALNLSNELLSLASPINSGFWTLSDKETTLIAHYPPTLPPLNRFAQLSRLNIPSIGNSATTTNSNGTHKSSKPAKELFNELDAIEIDAKQKAQHPVAITSKLIYATLTIHHDPETAEKRTKEALNIINITGHLKTFRNFGSTLLPSLSAIRIKEPQLTPLIDIILHLDASEPKPSGENSQSKEELLIKLLSKREKEIITLVVQGMSNEEIASHLCRSVGTVKLHIHKAYKKLDVKNRMETIKEFREHLLPNSPDGSSPPSS